MKFPNDLQAALLLDHPARDFDGLVDALAKLLATIAGAPFNRPEFKPGAYARLFGPGELMVTIERVGRPPNPAVFDKAFGSFVTGLLCPDARQRVARAQDMVLINLSHGVFGDSIHQQFGALFEQIGMPREGGNLPQFLQRLKVLAILAHFATDQLGPSLVHWVQSNLLLPGEKFEGFASLDAPSLLHVHPWLYGPAGQTGDEVALGIRTFGARHFIGYEFQLDPTTLPWADNLEVILGLIRLAISDKGYIVPHGDSFGPDDGRFSYRVLHEPADEGGVPVLKLVPLMFREHGFVSPDYVPRDRVIDDRSPPPGLMPDDDEVKEELANEWREKRRLAESAGAGFEVRARGTAPIPPAPVPRPGFGRAIFGRKKG